MTTGVVVLLAALATAAVLGLVKRRYDGRFREESGDAAMPTDRQAPAGAAAPDPPDDDTASTRALTADDLGGRLGSRATLVQFSSAFCAPCRATRQVLRDVAAKETGVAYVEIDAESHLELVRCLDVRRTPTVLVLDGAGQVLTRASGQPRRPDVLAALHQVDAA